MACMLYFSRGGTMMLKCIKYIFFYFFLSSAFAATLDDTCKGDGCVGFSFHASNPGGYCFAVAEVPDWLHKCFGKLLDNVCLQENQSRSIMLNSACNYHAYSFYNPYWCKFSPAKESNLYVYYQVGTGESCSLTP